MAASLVKPPGNSRIDVESRPHVRFGSKADTLRCGKPCPIYPRKRTSAVERHLLSQPVAAPPHAALDLVDPTGAALEAKEALESRDFKTLKRKRLVKS